MHRYVPVLYSYLWECSRRLAEEKQRVSQADLHWYIFYNFLMDVQHLLIYTRWSLSMNHHAVLLPLSFCCLNECAEVPQHPRWNRLFRDHLFGWKYHPCKEFFCPILYYSWIVQILIKNNNQMQTAKYLQYWESFQLWPPAVCILRGCNTFQTTFNPLIMNAFKTFDTENEIQLESLEIHSVMDATQEWIFKTCMYLQSK